MSFFNLHQHTTFSFLDGYGTPGQYLQRLKDLGSPGMALTDHGNIYSHHPFEKAFRGSGIHLAYGVEFYIVDELKQERGYYHITVLAKNNEGYGNLLSLVNMSNQPGQFYYKPRITFAQLVEKSKGLIILSGCCCDGWLAKNYVKGYKGWEIGAKREQFVWLDKFKEVEWYVELQPFEDEKEKWERLTHFAQTWGIPCLVTTDSHYPSPEEKEVQDFQLAINTARPKSDPDRLKMEYPLHIPTEEELRAKCEAMGSFNPEWITMTKEVGLSCQVELPKSSMVKLGGKIGDIRSKALTKAASVPEFHLEAGTSRYKGELREKISAERQTYFDRLNYELDLIEKKGFIDYFLIVADIVQWAKKRMLVGPGRGSAAGSLVCYLMGITEVDPLRWGCLFERFIDINRDDLPDIDIDFPPAERENIISYIREKYGEDHVAQLITFSTFKPRGVIQDGCRALGIPPWMATAAGAQVIERPDGDERAHHCLEDSIKQGGKLKQLFNEHPGLWDAVKLEGQIRQTSTHAAAVILSGRPLGEVGSISREGSLGINKKLLEEYGLLKIDVLGLENLSLIQDICKAVGVDHNDFYNLPLDDPLTFEKVLTPGKLLGIFQFEGQAVGKVSKKLKPTKFEQLVHITSLGRPGPLNSGTAWEYVERAHGKPYEIHPALEPYTKETLGCIIFQEQVMNVVKHIGGFSWKETGAVRKAMSKSLGDEFFSGYKKKFIEGAKASGVSKEDAAQIWDQIKTHGAYGFNLSHAVSYAIISYWTAYCKAHWPGEFYARALRFEEGGSKIRQYLKEWGRPVVAFDINESREHWTFRNKYTFSPPLDKNVLIGGFTNIKGIGEKQAPKLVAGQPYEDEQDALSRIPKGQMSKISAIQESGQPWADLRSLREKTSTCLEEISLSRELSSLPEIMPQAGKGFLVLGQVLEVSIRNHNDPDKVAKRGYTMDAPLDYGILKLSDGDSGEIYTLFMDRFMVDRRKEEILNLEDKICLFRIKKDGGDDALLSCVKYKILEEE